MKILVTIDPEIPVPPKNYGGIERIADGLINEYAKHSHEIMLLANPSSTCQAANKIIGWNGKQSENKKDTIKNAIQLYNVTRKFKPDIIHSFSRLMYLWPTFILTRYKAVMTYQREISPKTTWYTHKLAGNNIGFTACGQHMTNNLKLKNKFLPIHNFTDTDYFQDDEKLEKKYLMYLGRIQDIKGTYEAIEAAIASNNKLIIAGNIHPGHEDYYNSKIEPYLNHPLIKYVGPVNDEQKRFYLQRSKAFLFPIKWEEPFGIVMAEAMACGTPVIGFKRGSVPEVVKHNQTGYITNNVNEMVESIKKIKEIDRKTVRTDAIQRFSRDVIAKKYLDYFKKIATN